jgi:hypothetical protein
MDAIKSISKVKSFDKRIELLSGMLDGMEPEIANECVALVAEKAKHGQDFLELICVAGHLQFEDKVKKLLQFSNLAKDHPTQSGNAMWVIYQLGLVDETKSVWSDHLELWKDRHPNLYALAIAYGLLIPELVSEAEALISKAKKVLIDVPEELYEQPKLTHFCLASWLD